MTVKTVYNEGTENEYTEERDYHQGDWVDSVVASKCINIQLKAF